MSERFQAEIIDGYRRQGAFQRIGGARRTLVDNDNYAPELRDAWRAGWDEEDAKLGDRENYVPREACRI
jgi:hypothetical protein